MRSIRIIILFVVVGMGLAWTWDDWHSSARDLDTVDNLLRFTSKFFPPDFSDHQEILKGLSETIKTAFLATLISAPISLFLGACAGPWAPKLLKSMVVLMLAIMRSIPSLIWAMIAVAIMGPHFRAGVIALVFYSMGYLAKFFADDANNIESSLQKTYRRWGLPASLAFYYGFWPQIRQRFSSHVIWMFEYNIRSAAIIGYVGVGGLGLLLHSYQEYGQWDRFCAVLILILIIVLGFEVAQKIRRN